MFPNSHAALPLARHGNPETYRKSAEALAAARRSGSVEAIPRWAQTYVDSEVQSSGIALTAEAPASIEEWRADLARFAELELAEIEPGGGERIFASAQSVIAQAHGFLTWAAFVAHVQAMADPSSAVSRFEAAVEAVITGDLPTLKRLLLDDPALTRSRSTRRHRATLLHYVAANGVEGYRQTTPANALAINQQLLSAGAEVDATADLYGAPATTLELLATSIHPERAGVQEALLRDLLDRGASLTLPHRPRSLVTLCLQNGRLRAAEFLTAQNAPLDLPAAAGLGREAEVEAFLSGHLSAPELNEALLLASAYGRNQTIQFLLAGGADLSAATGDGQTALHRAVIGGHLETVELLLAHQAPLETRNRYGGTPLGQASWSAAHGGDPAVYAAIRKRLLAAGAPD